MTFGYQDHSIPERGEMHDAELRDEAAKRELVAEAKHDGQSGRQSWLARLIARLRGSRTPTQ